MAVVFHIAARAEWELAAAAGVYRTGSLDTEGFIHCSTAAQVAATANRLFAGRTDLVLLFIEGERLGGALRFEPVADPPGAVFPHVFAPIDLGAVFEVVALEPVAGRFGVHPEVAALGAVGDWTVEQAEARALAAMTGFRMPWWVAGGWALELHAATPRGHRLRPHADLEISILRRDQRALFGHLAGWQLCAVVGPGALEDWDGRTVPADVHQIWARRGPPSPPRPEQLAADPTRLEFFLEESDGHSWRFRREPAIARPLAELGATTPRGVPYVRPEVALLYKARHLRFKDRRDFEISAPALDATARGWLATALDRAHPGHPWSAELAGRAGRAATATDLDMVRAYYAAFDEWGRLDAPEGARELARALEILADRLAPGARVLDLGGGPGRYAIELAKRGHRVVLADLSAELLEVARRRVAAADLAGVESFDLVNAMDLGRYADGSFDAVIAFGPFYHLVGDAERRRAAAEIRRVLAAHGQAFIAFIPRLSGLSALIDRAANRPAQVPAAVLRTAADTGAFANPTGSGFQEGYYPPPGEIEQLFAATGFQVEDLLSLKSIANDRADRVARLDPAVRAEVERLTRALCREPEVIATCGHALLVARRSP